MSSENRHLVINLFWVDACISSRSLNPRLRDRNMPYCHTRKRFMSNWFFLHQIWRCWFDFHFINNNHFSVLCSCSSIHCVWNCYVYQISVNKIFWTGFVQCLLFLAFNKLITLCVDCFQLIYEKNRKTYIYCCRIESYLCVKHIDGLELYKFATNY